MILVRQKQQTKKRKKKLRKMTENAVGSPMRVESLATYSSLSTDVLVVAEGVLVVAEPVEVLSTVFSSRLRFGGR